MSLRFLVLNAPELRSERNSWESKSEQIEILRNSLKHCSMERKSSPMHFSSSVSIDSPVQTTFLIVLIFQTILSAATFFPPPQSWSFSQLSLLSTHVIIYLGSRLFQQPNGVSLFLKDFHFPRDFATTNVEKVALVDRSNLSPSL